MNEWNKLSMADRAAYIKLGIDNGITDLATIRDTYNKFAEGGYYDNKTTEVTLPEIVVTPSEVQKEYKLKVRPFLDKKAALDIGKRKNIKKITNPLSYDTGANIFQN